jgi:nucleotide-binding universal stress UspA family protein
MRMQIKSIICATDFSDLSNNAVNYGISLAKEFGAKLYLCHVIDLSSATMYDEATFAFETQYVHMEDYAHERLRFLVGAKDVDWEPLVTIGRAADEIARLAEEKKVDMAITATRGRSGLKRLVLGSVTEHLMRTLHCPLLTVKNPEDIPDSEKDLEVKFNRILVGCDFSPDSNLALQYGLSLAQEFQSELHLVHVVAPPIYKDLSKSTKETRDRFRQDLNKQLKEKLEAMVPSDARNWCKPNITLLTGRPDEELSKYAVVQDMDLLVMGVRGHGVVESLFVGATTDRVVRKSPCAVLAVRPMFQGD